MHREAPDHREARVVNPDVEVQGLHKDGTTFPLEFVVFPIETGGERLYAGACRDITEQRRAEGDTRKCNGEE